MPIYEYVCQDCNKLTSVFVRRASTETAPACEKCGSADTRRAVSRINIGWTESQVMERYGAPEPGQGADGYKDPRQIGRWVEKRFDEMGMELPSEARKMIDAAREGEFPEPVKDL